VVTFLTPEWVSALNEALQDAGVAAEDAPPLILQQLVDHPDGMRSAYRILIDATGAEAQAGFAADATVTYRQSYEVARGIAGGELDAHVEFLMGRVKISGDAKALVQHHPTLERVHDALAALRARTEFEVASG
jgi:hypothetical protein